MPREWVGRVPLDLRDGERIEHHEFDVFLKNSGGVLVLTSHRLLFARAHFWTDWLMEKFGKSGRWILLDRERAQITGVAHTPGTIVKSKITVFFGDEQKELMAKGYAHWLQLLGAQPIA